MNKHIIVIGGGIGGLASAVRLAARGVRVTLLERNPRVGGKLNLWEISHPTRPDERPFRFDTGPSLLTLPFVFEDLFRAAGENLHEHLELVRLDPIARFEWQDGTRFELRAGAEDLERELMRTAPEDVEGWKRFAARGKRIWDLSAEMFLFRAPEQLLRGASHSSSVPGNSPLRHGATEAPPCLGDSVVNPNLGHGLKTRATDALNLLLTPLRIGMFENYARAIHRHIRSRKLREVLYQYATYSGASPFKAPATLAVIPHAELHFGGWYVKGGMYRLAEALEAVARKLGVEIRTSCDVSRIIVRDARALGVRLNGSSEFLADAVVCNADVVHAYRSMIDAADRPNYPDRKLEQLDPGGSGMALLLGVEGTYPQLAHHTKLMPQDYRSDLDAMFRHRSIPRDPCIYVCASTRSDPSQAPAGCENLFVLCSAPALDGKLHWEVQSKRYRDQIVRTLETRWEFPGLSKRIVVERAISPKDLRELYNANAGSIYGLGSNSRRSAFLRPPNRDRHIRGLYFAGGATHPGGGLPLVALSGKIASEMVMEELGV